MWVFLAGGRGQNRFLACAKAAAETSDRKLCDEANVRQCATTANCVLLSWINDGEVRSFGARSLFSSLFCAHSRTIAATGLMSETVVQRATLAVAAATSCRRVGRHRPTGRPTRKRLASAGGRFCESHDNRRFQLATGTLDIRQIAPS